MLEIKDLHVKFHTRDREAVGGISFSVADGEIVGLVGESGSGKTVTAMSIGGLLDREICDARGEVSVDGVDVLSAGEQEMRKIKGKLVSVVFQEPYAASDPLMKIGKQVEEVLKIHTDMGKTER
ncbi:MAG: ABC transporter ATP-binding protein, partial [Oscillospiraceae bacterium]|nr:ABC transporter ATP-binding protein [Oscillospiraceae bacterium]